MIVFIIVFLIFYSAFIFKYAKSKLKIQSTLTPVMLSIFLNIIYIGLSAFLFIGLYRYSDVPFNYIRNFFYFFVEILNMGHIELVEIFVNLIIVLVTIAFYSLYYLIPNSIILFPQLSDLGITNTKQIFKFSLIISIISSVGCAVFYAIGLISLGY